MEQFRTRYRYGKSDGLVWIARITPESFTRIDLNGYSYTSSINIVTDDSDQYDSYKDEAKISAKSFNAIRDAAFRGVKGLDEDLTELHEVLTTHIPSSKRNIAVRITGGGFNR